MDVFCLMALEINKTDYRMFMSAKIPIEIGCNIKPCPHCGSPMSWAYDHYFCRVCGYNQNGTEVDKMAGEATNYERKGQMDSN